MRFEVLGLGSIVKVRNSPHRGYTGWTFYFIFLSCWCYVRLGWHDPCDSGIQDPSILAAILNTRLPSHGVESSFMSAFHPSERNKGEGACSLPLMIHSRSLYRLPLLETYRHMTTPTAREAGKYNISSRNPCTYVFITN